MRIGVISDTHGLVRPEVHEVFAGVDHILHAGDIGGEEVLAELASIARVTACAGNNDGWRCGPARRSARISLGGLRFLLVHIRDEAHAELRRGPADVVVFGHSHKPLEEHRDGIWWFNPGSAGPRRFSLPVCVGLFERVGGNWRARHIALTGAAGTSPRRARPYAARG
jgi:putative phosphoesterase